MDPEERGAPPARDKVGQTGAVTRVSKGTAALREAIAGYTRMAVARVAGYGYAPLTAPSLVLTGAPATVVASMPAGSSAPQDPTSSEYNASEPIRPRPHEIPHIEPDPGWNLPRPAHLPRPTYWPAVLALGIVFLAWGLVTNPVVTAFGVIVFFVALLGWIGEMRHDS